MAILNSPLGGGRATLAKLLQAVQVFGADAYGPGPQLILRDSEPDIRVVVADTVEGRLRFVIGNSQQQSSTTARDQRSRRQQQPFLLQPLQIGAVRVSMLEDFFQRLAVANDSERVHKSLGRAGLQAGVRRALNWGLQPRNGLRT